MVLKARDTSLPGLTALRPERQHCRFCRMLAMADASSPAGELRAAECGALPSPGRRLLSGMLVAGAVAAALPQRAWALDDKDAGVDVGNTSRFTKLVPAADLEQAAGQQYQQMLRKARSKDALAPQTDPQAVRLRFIADRIIPNSYEWNKRARDWKWEVNLIRSAQLNAFCMPGGKIAFYSGILQKLQLNDDEVAMIMGHEAAHALREHARAQIGKSMATRLGVGALSALLGLGNAGDALLNMGGQLLSLKFSRSDESEADLVGLELAARSGYDPGAGITLWKKMTAVNQGAPMEFLSTHPAGPERIKQIQDNLPRVEPLYRAAPRPSERFEPPAK